MNKNSIKIPYYYSLPAIILSILLVAAFIYAQQNNWQEPTQNPPQGNVPAPLNVGNQGQAKEGGLILNTGGAQNGLIVHSGKVGIGTGDNTIVFTLTVNNDLGVSSGEKLLAVIRRSEIQESGGVAIGYYSNGNNVTGGIIRSTNNLPLFIGAPNAGQALTISANTGNVGIGTTTPGQKLDVVGGYIRSNTGFCIGSSCINSWPSGGGISGSGTTNYITKWTGSSSLGNSIIYDNGTNVGIGTTTPGYKLDVRGKIYANDGVNNSADIIAEKIDVSTTDPVFTIGGVRYSTYYSGMTGVKEETTGVITLEKRVGDYEYVIDFNKVEQGSDLWLFAKVTNLENEGLNNMTVLLSPNFEGRVWYEKKSKENKIIIYGKPNNLSESLEVSYRLTAPRFDYRDWTNYSNSSFEGLNLDNYLQR
jgi:hypothetical protein